MTDIIGYNEIKDNEEFWLMFLSAGFSQGYDEESDISTGEFIEENYEPDMEWSDEFTGYYDGVLDDSDGYVDNPKRLETELAEGRRFSIEFHPGDTLFYLNDEEIGSTGGHFKIGVISFSDFEKYTENLSYGEKLLVLPMVKFENSDRENFKILIEKCLEATPIKKEDFEMCSNLIISHCLGE